MFPKGFWKRYTISFNMIVHMNIDENIKTIENVTFDL